MEDVRGNQFNGAIAITAVDPGELPTEQDDRPTINVVPLHYDHASDLRYTEVNGDIMSTISGQIVADNARGPTVNTAQGGLSFGADSVRPPVNADNNNRYAIIPHPKRILDVIQRGEDQLDTPDMKIKLNRKPIMTTGTVSRHHTNSAFLGTHPMIGTRAHLHASGIAKPNTVTNVGLNIFGGIGKAIGSVLDGGNPNGTFSQILGTVGSVVDTVVPFV